MLHTRIKPSEVYHAIIVAFYNESRDVLEPTIKSVIDSHYDLKKIILILAYEERGGADIESLAQDLVKEYGHHFHHAEAVKHPHNIPGEVIGKGGNVTFAGRRLKEYLEEEKIDPMNVIVTTLDSDNRPDKQYFAALTYTYCSTEDPKHASYQPITIYMNNIWDAPAPMRVIATGNSFWNVVLSLRPHMLRNFSAHSQPMAALIDTDFWSVRTIVEDGHQYWRTYFRYDSNHEVYPIFVPIYQDAVLTDSYKRTLKMQFVQVRRWAWGASDIAYVFNQGFLKKNNIPKHKVIGKFLRLLEGHVSWSTAPLLLLLAALVPFFLNPDSYLANQLPQVASKLQTVAMVGILVTLYLSMRTLPPKPERYKRRRNLWMVIQWVYLPVTSIIYSSFAAIYAQTRLMFGWYLGFIVTEKAVKK
jgi:cellulose synthase/poly-beta-1,6-N-acetylglucosamine synthase-like glycosyltransferase